MRTAKTFQQCPAVKNKQIKMSYFFLIPHISVNYFLKGIFLRRSIFIKSSQKGVKEESL